MNKGVTRRTVGGTRTFHGEARIPAADLHAKRRRDLRQIGIKRAAQIGQALIVARLSGIAQIEFEARLAAGARAAGRAPGRLLSHGWGLRRAASAAAPR